MDKPKISVITPSYQQHQYLEKTIHSVIEEDYPNLEYIVIDGGSTDGSVELIKRYSSHINYWESKKDKGQSDGINKGLRQVSGDIVTWLNSDDSFCSGTLNKVAETLTEEIGLVYGDTEILYGQEGSEIRRVGSEDFDAKMLGGMPFSQPSCFFNGHLMRSEGLLLNEDLHYGMDYYFFLQLFCISDFKYCPSVLSRYLIHPASKSATNFIGFAEEWSWIYYSFIAEVHPESKISNRISLLIPGINEKPLLPFKVKKRFSVALLEDSFFFFLWNQVKFRYAALDLSKTRELLKTIEELYPSKFTDHQLAKIRNRTYMPKMMLGMIRNLSSTNKS